MNTPDTPAILLVKAIDCHRRELNTLRNCQSVQGISIMILGLFQIVHIFAAARGMK